MLFLDGGDYWGTKDLIYFLLGGESLCLAVTSTRFHKASFGCAIDGTG